MKLTQGVYCYDCGEYVYLRNVNDAKDYLFNAIGYDIIQYIGENPGCQEEDVCAALAQLYEVESLEDLRSDVAEFIQELTWNGLIAQEEQAVSQEPVITDQVEELRRKEGRLYSAFLELTYRCNEKCVHCYVDDGCEANVKGELTLAEYRGILDQLKELGCIQLLLTGGEVCMHRDFLEIAEYAVSKGFLVNVYTNGIGITDHHFDRLCEMKVNSVSFSLYSGDPAVHDAITKVPGSFDRTLKRIMMFKCAGVDTFIKTVVIQQNLDSLESLFLLGKRLGIAVNAATMISDSHMGVSKGSFRLQDQQQRLRAAQLLQKYDPVVQSDLHRDMDGPVCRAGLSTLSIDPYGGVHPCLAFTKPVASLRERPLREIWEQDPLMKSLRSFRFRDLSEKCGDCRYADTCGVCIGSAYSESDCRLCPNIDACQWSEAKYDAIYRVVK